MRNIEYIIIHCSATREGQDISAATIDKWHKARGWKGIGYHYVVGLNGQIEFGRPEAEVGAHAKGYNSNSIGICYIGGVESDGRTPKDTRTPQQKESLLQILRALKVDYPNAIIIGHRDVSSKACPSFEAKQEYHKLNY